MTGNIFFDAGIIFLSLYAIIHICHQFVTYLVEKFSVYRHRDFLVLLLSTGTETLEMDIRMAIKRSETFACSLLIVDMGLLPEEQMILYRLADPYNHVILSAEHELTSKICRADAINGEL